MSTEMSPAQLATAAEHLMAAKMFSLASCVMLFYDIVITFGDEVERIWKQRLTGATVLWFLNRYLSPLGYIVIIVSFHDPSWSKAVCQRYVLYPEVLKVFTATSVGIIFILRLYSIYSKSKTVLYGFSTLLVLELAIKIWAFTDGVMLQLPPGFVGCILTGKDSPGDRIIYTWVAELVFDSCVFFATLYRTIQLYKRTLIGEALSLITVIMRDGIMYFAAIFVSNLVTVLIFIFATNDLKVINASFSTLITSLMVSRLMLNLRGEVLRRGPVLSAHSMSGRSNGGESYQLSSTGYSKPPTQTQTQTGWSAFESSIVGNLGAPVITFERENQRYYEFNIEDEDVLDPGLPPSPHSANTPRTLRSRSPHSQSRHPYPPSTPTSPHSAAHLTRSHHDHDGFPRRSVDSSMGWYKVSMPDLTAPSRSSTQLEVVSLPTRTFSTASPNHSAHRLRPSTSASSTASSAGFTALSPSPPKQKLSRKSLRRPRTNESQASARSDVNEMMHTRSLPTPLVVQVTEEVVVDRMEVQDADLARSTRGVGSERGPPWFAPPSWNLSRDGQQREGGGGG